MVGVQPGEKTPGLMHKGAEWERDYSRKQMPCELKGAPLLTRSPPPFSLAGLEKGGGESMTETRLWGGEAVALPTFSPPLSSMLCASLFLFQFRGWEQRLPLHQVRERERELSACCLWFQEVQGQPQRCSPGKLSLRGEGQDSVEERASS